MLLLLPVVLSVEVCSKKSGMVRLLRPCSAGIAVSSLAKAIARDIRICHMVVDFEHFLLPEAGVGSSRGRNRRRGGMEHHKRLPPCGNRR